MGTLIDYFTRVANYDWRVVGIESFLIGLVVYWSESSRGSADRRRAKKAIIASIVIHNAGTKTPAPISAGSQFSSVRKIV